LNHFIDKPAQLNIKKLQVKPYQIRLVGKGESDEKEVWLRVWNRRSFGNSIT
jgi:hypothetical protein